MKISIVVVLLFAVLFCSPFVRADEPALGERGHVALAVERLFGYSHQSSTTTTDGVKSSQSGNVFSLFGNGGVTDYSIPRVAADVFMARDFSIGLAGGLVHVTGSGDGMSDRSGTVFQLAPRLGYLFHAAPRLAIWPRAGVTYERSSITDESMPPSTTRTSLMAVTIDVPIAIKVLARAALLIVPFGDIGVAGSMHEEAFGDTIDRDAKATEFGVQFGMLIFL